MLRLQGRGPGHAMTPMYFIYFVENVKNNCHIMWFRSWSPPKCNKNSTTATKEGPKIQIVAIPVVPTKYSSY